MTLDGNIVARQPVRPQRDGHQRRRPRVRRQRQRQLLLAGRRDSTFPADHSTFARLRRAERVQPVRPGPDARRWTGEGALNGVGQAPAPGQAGLHAARGLRPVRVMKVLVALLAGVALISAAPAHGAAKKTITIGDNYYAPTKLTVKRGHDRHLALARLRAGRRRPRRQARVGPQGREEVPLRGRRRRTTATSAS